MKPLLSHILNYIKEKNPAHGAKLNGWILQMDENYFSAAEGFFSRYKTFIESTGKNIDYGIDCYLKLCAQMIYERLEFVRSGKYANTSFEEVEKSIYLNPEMFEYHMHGLVFAQFLWREQYTRFEFFSSHIRDFLSAKPQSPQTTDGRDSAGTYLEIGGGHALYILEAIKKSNEKINFQLVDISPSSMELAKGIAKNLPINFLLKNIFDFSPEEKFDFITMGEVIEHVEDPLSLLIKVRELLSENGAAFISTPANSPTIDHIYLFNNADEIRSMLNEAGLEIIHEKTQYAEEMKEERAQKLKIALMFAAFVKAKTN